MYTRKLSALVPLIALLTVFSSAANAKSVYSIIDHGYRPPPIYRAPAKIAAYGINADQIDLQKTLTLDQNDYPTGSYFGPVGLAIDSESEYMFVTHEKRYGGLEGIQLINAKTMMDEGVIEVQGAPDLAGIVFDNERQKVYTVERGTNKLFVLLWDVPTKTLTLEGGEPKTLAEIGNYACGLALDEIDDILYVTSIEDFHSAVSNVVHYYDVNDPNWTHKGSIEIVVDSNDRYAVGIAVYNDGQGTKYLYTGAYDFFESNDYLVRTDINDINNPSSTEKDIGSSAIAVAVDDDTGLVYVTTSNNHIEVYNPATWPSDPCCIEDANINGPAGICVPTADVSYKPGLLTLSKIDDVNDGNCVSPGDYITYKITYGPNGVDHNNVVITDYLPCEVYYEDIFDPNYDYEKHTYTWEIGSLSASAPNDFVTLAVKVNQLAEPLGKITNVCEIESDIAYSTAEVNTPVCCWSPDIIYVDVNAVGSDSGLSWYHADPNLQRALQKAQAWDSNQIWVAAGRYKPTTEPGDYYTAFELVNGVDIYGGFAGNESAITQRNLMINETILDGNLPPYGVYYVVGANDVNETTIIDGFTITNGWWMGIYSVNSSLIIGHNRISDNGYGIYCINWSSVNVTNCDIINNRGRENEHGGGIYCEDSNNLTIADCMIIDNISDANGGGIYCEDANNVTITNCTFTNNSAKRGGGLSNKSSDPNVTNCIFTGNTTYYYGGGIYNNQSFPTVVNCIFSGNRADYYGGGMSNRSGSPMLTNCTFTGNSAYYGGGLCNWDDSDPNVTNCIFSGNLADANGGGVYNDDSSPNITNCIFSGNTADYYGGGIANSDNSNPALTNCTFSGNWAHYGGGICNWNYSDPNVTNSIFWDNEAGIEGNEIYDYNSAPNVTYCDVKGGYGGTGNIDEDPCFFDVSEPNGSWTENASYDNSTFQSTLTDEYANWAVNELAGKFVNPDTSQSLQFLIVSNDSNTIKVLADVNSVADVNDTYQIYDYHLSYDSPCIDAGDPNFNPDPNETDIDGEPRRIDGDGDGSSVVDMGADEYDYRDADFDNDGIVNFIDYAMFANTWQTENPDFSLDGDNDVDMNDLALFVEDWLWIAGWAQTEGLMMGQGMSRGSRLMEGLYLSAPAKQQPTEIKPLDIEEIIKWLDEIWLDEEVRKVIDEDEWLKFMESIKEQI